MQCAGFCLYDKSRCLLGSPDEGEEWKISEVLEIGMWLVSGESNVDIDSRIDIYSVS